MNITIVGTGYVGLSIAVLLSQKHSVVALDVEEKKVQLINHKQSPIEDKEIEEYIKTKELNLLATIDKELAYKNPDYVVICTPTDYDTTSNYFDTSSIDAVLYDLKQYCPGVPVIIKSTIPVGFTRATRKKFDKENIFFSPEFLREGRALFDNLHPSRIIVGSHLQEAKVFSKLLFDASLDKNTKVILMGSTEAEAVKLFSNTYLALRVAYFNELDSYAESHSLNTREIINGVSLDPRIGFHYNNPSFGWRLLSPKRYQAT